jgi:hypothetical protein
MPKEENNANCCRGHKIMMGLGLIIFGLVLFFTSSDASVEANLNWPGAFFVIGVLYIAKVLFYARKKK